MRSFAKQAEKQTYMPNAKMGHDLVTILLLSSISLSFKDL